ncbi:ParB/RepB/Spo0J family partition protein [Christensenella tenuis]|uniref:ParB/RepB/Spo0J family partition protein n=1 Tax=Christensenella tenuis TaxID=2763033 RepID=A0ABR7EGM3_9FIRM|nr:ParB/RepB/Spo0J family partition protein [Christensenella tenuis]MBC5648189.1 ParB/RepB/Spo0J family partition protein [Christensenella tenuis]
MSGEKKKVKIGSDDWFPSLPQEGNETREIRELPIDEFYPFKNHPFKIRDDAEMLELIESVKRIGIQIPILARPRDGKDGVETIAGHRRLQAAIMAGLETAPAIVTSMDDDEATIIMVDTNLGQRVHILPSEKAFAYRMKTEAVIRKLGRPEKNVGQDVPHLGKRTTEIIGETGGDSYKQVERYIRLTYLIQPLLDMVDNKELDFIPAVDLSYLKNKEQIWAGCAVEKYGKISGKQAGLMKVMSKEGILTEEGIEAIMRAEQPLDMKVTLRGTILQKYFPKDYTPKQMQEIIIQLLENWKREHERDGFKLIK